MVLSVAYFWVISAGCSVEFHVDFKHFQNLENLILKENCIFLALWSLFSIKPCKAFIIVKPCLNYDLYFIFKTSGTAVLEAIAFYKPPLSISQENRKTSLAALLDTSTTTLMCIFFSILNCSWASQEFNNEGMKVQVKRAFKSYFLPPKNNKKADRLSMKFSSTSNTSEQKCLYPLFQNQSSHFLVPPLFRRISQPSGQDQ